MGGSNSKTPYYPIISSTHKVKITLESKIRKLQVLINKLSDNIRKANQKYVQLQKYGITLSKRSDIEYGALISELNKIIQKMDSLTQRTSQLYEKKQTNEQKLRKLKVDLSYINNVSKQVNSHKVQYMKNKLKTYSNIAHNRVYNRPNRNSTLNR